MIVSKVTIKKSRVKKSRGYEQDTITGHHRWVYRFRSRSYWQCFPRLGCGWNFFSGLDIYEYTGLEEYELAAYVGAIIGAVLMTIVGAKSAWRIVDKKDKGILNSAKAEELNF